jgi:hypothetical protein
MSPGQVLAIAALGGLCAAIALIICVALAVGIYILSSHLAELHEQRREERQNLKACRAIDELGTTNHPKE